MWENEYKHDNHLQPTVCSSDPKELSCEVRVGSEGATGWSRGWVSTSGLRGHLRPEAIEEMHDWSPKELLIMQDEGYRAEPVNIGLGGKKEGGRRCFLPLLDMPVGLSLLWSCQEESYLESQICLCCSVWAKIPADSQTRHQIHWFTFSGKKEKTSILTQVL